MLKNSSVDSSCLELYLDGFHGHTKALCEDTVNGILLHLKFYVQYKIAGQNSVNIQLVGTKKLSLLHIIA